MSQEPKATGFLIQAHIDALDEQIADFKEEIARLKAEKAELLTALKTVKEKSKGSAWSCNQEMRDRWTEAIKIVDEAILKSQRGKK